MTSIGYGDISPQSTLERACALILMFVASGVYALLINDVSHIVNNFNSLASEYK